MMTTTTCGQQVRAGINKRLNHFKDLTCEMHDPSLEEEEKKKTEVLQHQGQLGRFGPAE